MRESYLYGVIGLLAGVLLTSALLCTGPWGMRGDGKDDEHAKHGMDMSMNGMTSALDGKSGDDFDKAFLVMMIPHHQGAVEMAELARKNAKHDEVKALAEAIIASQTKEIDDMKNWQKSWGY